MGTVTFINHKGEIGAVETMTTPKNPENDNIQIIHPDGSIGYLELTEDITKTNLNPTKQIEKNGELKYVREKFIENGYAIYHYDTIIFNGNNSNELYDYVTTNVLKYDTLKAINHPNTLTDMTAMFVNKSNLTTLDLSSFDMSNVTTTLVMFYNCINLTTLDLSSFDMSNVTNMASMFNNCINLTTLDLSTLDTNNITDMEGAFYGCNNLTTVYCKTQRDADNFAEYPDVPPNINFIVKK